MLLCVYAFLERNLNTVPYEGSADIRGSAYLRVVICYTCQGADDDPT